MLSSDNMIIRGILISAIKITYLLQESYNTGDYINAVVNRQRAETISSILFPDDRSYQVCFHFLL